MWTKSNPTSPAGSAKPTPFVVKTKPGLTRTEFATAFLPGGRKDERGCCAWPPTRISTTASFVAYDDAIRHWTLSECKTPGLHRQLIRRFFNGLPTKGVCS